VHKEEPLPFRTSQTKPYLQLPPLSLENYRQILLKILAPYHPSKSNYPQRSPPPQQPFYFLLETTAERPDSLPT